MAKEIKTSYKAIGVMAGSSTDGLDVAETLFKKGKKWSYEVLRSKTFPYDEEVLHLLHSAPKLEKNRQNNIDRFFGEWIGDRLAAFGVKDVDVIGIHGQTVVHQPENGISWQLGDGDIVSKRLKTTTVTDFRSQDVLLGGQGAPLVPFGDFELFPDYDACLNLGGIANVSIRQNEKAWDICPCNQVLDFFAAQLGLSFDDGGKLAREGTIHREWTNVIKEEEYFKKKPPKSLPNHFISKEILGDIAPKAGLASYTRFLVEQITHDVSLGLRKGGSILVTGGGAWNTYLIELLNRNAHGFRWNIPGQQLVNFKEAMVFAFLAILRLRNEPNVLASVTGASEGSSSGKIRHPEWLDLPPRKKQLTHHARSS